MHRVYFIYWWRRMFGSRTFNKLLAAGVLSALALFFVSIGDIWANSWQGRSLVGVASYYYSAFWHTEMVNQILAVAIGLTFTMLVWDLARLGWSLVPSWRRLLIFRIKFF